MVRVPRGASSVSRGSYTGSMATMQWTKIEETKIECARKFFDEINRKYAPENVKYNVVNSFGKLMELVK